MKARLIWNGILSIVTTITFFIAILLTSRQYLTLYYVSLFILVCASIAEFVLGIVTLSMEKDDYVRGLTIASGVLGIIGIPLFVNAIVSFIAVAKMNKKYLNKEETVDNNIVKEETIS